MAQVPLDGDDPSSNFSPVLDGGSEDVSILPLEQSWDTSGGELVFVARLFLNKTMSPT